MQSKLLILYLIGQAINRNMHQYVAICISVVKSKLF